MRALEEIWLLGDEFVTKTSATNFTDRSFDSYAKSNYDVTVFASCPYASNVPELRKVDNMLARLTNTLLSAMRQKSRLPKMIVIIFEDDLIKFLNYNDYGVTEMFKKVLEFLTKTIRKSIDEFKTSLPVKAKRVDTPQLVWILPTNHQNYLNNTLRRKFATELEKVTKAQRDSTFLKLRQVWDTANPKLVSPTKNRMTSEGLQRYWEAVDRTIRYADWKIFKEKEATMTRLFIQHQRESEQRAQPEDTTVFSQFLKK